jgi:type IX secretion system PorP/SprF family membrane protein
MRFVNRRGTRDILGAGITFFSDKAGDADLTHTNVNGTIAYHKNLDRFGVNYFGGCLQVGYGGGSVDFFRLLFPDQYVSPGVTQPTQQYPFDSYRYIDASAGLAYNWIPEERNNHIQVGAAVHHLNEPRKSFLVTKSSVIPRKYVLHASGQVRLDEHFELYPKINVAIQAGQREIMYGTFGRLDLDKMRTDKYGVYVGLWQRLVGGVDKAVSSDALVLVTRLDVDQISVAFSYDINTSKLKTATQARGGPEFSVIYIGCIPRTNQKAVYCPRF